MSHILVVDILESFLGEHRKHNEDTGQIGFDCPACAADKGMLEGDGKGNLEVNYEKGVFKCWACQDINNMHGPVIKLLKKYGTSKNLRDYLLVKPEAKLVNKDNKPVIVTLPEGYKRLSDPKNRDYNALEALSYLKRRGITDELICKFDIGYTTVGKFHHRIIIPSYDSENNLNYFIARWYRKDWNKFKYLNPAAEKQEIVFNESKIRLDSTIYLVEGVTDHIVIPNSIPLLGKHLPIKLLELLQDNANSYVVIVLDGDAYEDGLMLYQQLNFGRLRDKIKIISTPEGHDPSTIYQKLGRKGIVKLLRGAKKIPEKDLKY